MPRISKEESDYNFARRVEGGADRVNLQQSLQSQQDILSLSGITYKVSNDQIQGMLAKKVTKSGKNFMQFLIDDVLQMALAYQKVFIAVDRMPVPDGLSVAEAEQYNDEWCQLCAAHGDPRSSCQLRGRCEALDGCRAGSNVVLRMLIQSYCAVRIASTGSMRAATQAG